MIVETPAVTEGSVISIDSTVFEDPSVFMFNFRFSRRPHRRSSPEARRTCLLRSFHFHDRRTVINRSHLRSCDQPTDLPPVSFPNTATTMAAIAAVTLIAMKIDVDPKVVSIQPTIIGISTVSNFANAFATPTQRKRT